MTQHPWLTPGKASTGCHPEPVEGPDPELTMGQLSRLLGISEHTTRRHLRQADSEISTSPDNHELVPLDTLITLHDRSNGRLAQQLAQIIQDNK